MSEKQPLHEHSELLKPIESSPEISQQLDSRELSSHEKNHGSKEQVEAIAKMAEKHAIAGKEVSAGENEHTNNQHPAMIGKHLKDMAFSRALTRARKKLSTPSRVFSRFVHLAPIDKASEVLGKTVARPSGMLGGAIIAFLGTSALLWITRHYGYEYNYLLVIILFAMGMAVGLLGEVLLKAFRKSK